MWYEFSQIPTEFHADVATVPRFIHAVPTATYKETHRRTSGQIFISVRSYRIPSLPAPWKRTKTYANLERWNMGRGNRADKRDREAGIRVQRV